MTRLRDIYWQLGFALVLLVGSVLRFVDLAYYNTGLLFDEDPYVPHAWSLVNVGYELGKNSAGGYDMNISDALHNGAAFAAHPPLGKLLIGTGMLMFGGPGNAASYRVTAAVFGVILLALTMLVAKKLTGNSAIALTAGALLAVDGQAVAMSRIGMLDVFLAVFVLAAFHLVLMDRSKTRTVIAERLTDRDNTLPTILWRRPWLWASSVMLGLATAIKLEGGFFLLGFLLYLALSERRLRQVSKPAKIQQKGKKKAAPAPETPVADPTVSALLQTAKIAAVSLPLYLLTYVATWFSWFTHDQAYDRQWAHGGNALLDTVSSFVHYHVEMLTFHTGLDHFNFMSSSPWGWLFMLHPSTAAWELPHDGVTDVPHFINTGNLAIWWPAAVAFLYLTYRAVKHRDPVAGAVVVPVAITYLPWFLFPSRVMYLYYTLPFQAFLEIGLAYALWLTYRHVADGHGTRTATVVSAAYAGAVLVVFALTVPYLYYLPTSAGYFDATFWLAGLQGALPAS